MDNLWGDLRRVREDQYFQQQEQQRLAEMRRQAAREAELRRLAEAFGIRDAEVVHQLAEAGFDSDTFRALYLVPLIQVAWSDGAVSRLESERILEIARLHGIAADSAAHARLAAWLRERPSDHFFQVCVRGIRAMLGHRPRAEARALRRDLAWYCDRIASASGGFLGLGPRISREEESLLKRLAAELHERHPVAAGEVSRRLQP